MGAWDYVRARFENALNSSVPPVRISSHGSIREFGVFL
jgi:hypothetical protein